MLPTEELDGLLLPNYVRLPSDLIEWAVGQESYRPDITDTDWNGSRETRAWANRFLCDLLNEINIRHESVSIEREEELDVLISRTCRLISWEVGFSLREKLGMEFGPAYGACAREYWAGFIERLRAEGN